MASITAASRRMASYSASGRKFFVGGNFKANGSLADAQKLIATLNAGTIASR